MDWGSTILIKNQISIRKYLGFHPQSHNTHGRIREGQGNPCEHFQFPLDQIHYQTTNFWYPLMELVSPLVWVLFSLYS